MSHLNILPLSSNDLATIFREIFLICLTIVKYKLIDVDVRMHALDETIRIRATKQRARAKYLTPI